MRVECSECGAKYQFDQAALAGRTARAKCKRCGSPIVLQAPVEPAKTAARDESSVLFSLGSLQAMAAHRTAPTTAGTSEGSGLLDVRSLAAALATPNAAPAGTVTLADAAAITPFTLSPPIAPVASQASERAKSLRFAATLVGVSILVAGGIVAGAMRPSSSAPGGAELATLVPGSAPVAPNLAAPAASPPIAVEPAPSPAMEALPALAPEPVTVRPTTSDRPRRPTTPPEPVATAPIATRTREPASLEDLINRVVEPQTAATERTAPRTVRAESLPATPSRDDAMRAMAQVRAALTTCAAGAHGTFTANVVVTGATGRVTSSSVDGAFAGTPAGSCMARALRSPTFPRFERESFTLRFPFRL